MARALILLHNVFNRRCESTAMSIWPSPLSKKPHRSVMLGSSLETKVLFDLRNDAAAVDWRNYFRPPRYFASGY